MSLRVGIDVGGTFTDITVLDVASGEIREVKKVPSNPQRQIEVFDHVLEEMSSQWGAEAVSYLLHGSTHALNAILEEKGAVTGLLVTEGFRDVYEVARQWKGDEVMNILYPGATRFIPRRRIGQVRERVDFQGNVLVPLDLSTVDHALDELVGQGIEALAIVLLHSYANPAHERQVAAHVRQRFPNLYISLSSEVNPLWREYERTCSTVINSYVGPQMGRYLSQLEQSAKKRLRSAYPLVMKSSGGVGTPSYLGRFPIHTLMSGPVAGVVAAHELGQSLGRKNVLGLDVGGTSCDVSLIPGAPLFRSEWAIGRHPVRVDSVEVDSIGAGGGSIARVRYGSVLQVGPQSAGANPGPACYMRGGTEPTLTDALVELGQLNPSVLLGGGMAIDRQLSTRAIQSVIAGPLNLSVQDSALGIERVLVANVVSTMRTLTVERGYDPREFSLVAFGGMGPTVGTAVAAALGIGEVIVPANPGNFSAYGMLLSDLRYDLVITRLMLLNPRNLLTVTAELAKLEGEARRELCGQGALDERIEARWLLDLRYRGQAYELTVPIAHAARELAMEKIADDFGRVHERRYGHRADAEQIEIVNLRVSASYSLGKPRSVKLSAGVANVEPRERRNVSFLAGSHLTPVFEREKLPPGFAIDGPVIIEEKTSTVVAEPGWQLSVDDAGNLLLHGGARR
ncbi:MAG: hydantoinase/oxoprolinase family protein [Candidatus Binatia bacterium]